MTNPLDPKTAVRCLSLIPQFIDLREGHVLAQGLLLGGAPARSGPDRGGVGLAIVLAAGATAAFLSRSPPWLRAQRYLMGTVLGGLAVSLAAGTSRPGAA
ncbi:hypothetical protein NX801_03240 [Streptomyces sp. LP05-1]|uniref:Uncharacterized protein n=1 Tax=Streptomyces pyxinae TaxID=2970734 RepID=A0ABT2CBF0_9ACTN|nr:hypothetical protein [Streptomyces sp. LP05-1]MCS0634688.1 hypothetical protein [Streptomyces sp. LP05-1]